MAEALYRKYRPQVFEDVVGQNHVERTLKNAIDQDKVSHAYLFCGPRGTGKTTTARLLAKALLCENGPTSSPDGTCRECLDVADGAHPDVYELDAASRTGVENVREEIIGRVNFAPTRGSKKIYIIDEVHMLSTAAFNALLKTLEEPPSHVVFVLCTTDPQKVPATIHSRCQRFDFHRLSSDEIVARLGAVCVSEGVEFDGDALDLIAHRAEGGMRNALTALEQLIAFGDGTVTVQGAEDLLGSLDSSDMAEIVNAIGRRDVAACFNWTANYVESGADLAQFARDMAERIRNIYVMSLAGTDVSLDVADAERRQLAEELRLFGPDRLARLLGVLGDLISELRTASNPRLCFEIALTRMVRPDSDLTLESLAERIEALEAGKSAVAMYVPNADASKASENYAPAPQAAVTPDPQQAGNMAPARSGNRPNAVPPAQRPQPQAAAQMPPQRPASRPAQPSKEAFRPAPAPQKPQAATQAPVPVPAQQPSPNANQAQPTSHDSAQGSLASIVSNPAALQRVWRSVVTAVKKENVSYGVLFVNVKARAEADGSGVVVEFPADNPFAFAMASKPEVQAAISKAFNQVAGLPVPYRCVQAQGGTRQAAPSAVAPRTGSAPAPHAVPRDAGASQGSAQVPQQPAQPAPMQQPRNAAPRPAPAAPAPLDDEVPLDVYDDVEESYEGDYSYGSYESVPAPIPAKPDDSPAAQAEPKLAFAEQRRDAVDSPTQTQEPPANADDLSKMLSGSMGMNITFEEVDE